MNKAGVSLWRQIGETLTEEIEQGVHAENERLPPASELASRFSVNRHTVLKAISHLQSDGLIRIERGRGAYAIVNPLQFRIGPRRWFEQNLLESNLTPSRTIISIQTRVASAEAAKALKLPKNSQVAFVTLLGEADGFPVNLGYNYFPLKRLPEVEAVFRSFGEERTESFSFRALFRKLGVKDARRKRLRIRSRTPSREEAQRLQMAPNDHVLVTFVTQVDTDDVPVAYAETCYCSSRVDLVLDL
ncbi:MAG: phosphonate metabolism transcriptional regulator PhnF [Gammaproteobacteria bacterium]